jgi:dUTP pyrophosphatase
MSSNHNCPIVLPFVRTTSNAKTTTRGSEKAAGLDLYSACNIIQTIAARGNAFISTDVQVQLPPGCYRRIAPRSGLALQHHIDVGAGVVNEYYCGNLGVVLFNHSDKACNVSCGDRIVQLICEQIYYPELKEVKRLNDTERSKDGFGSTGM